MPNDCNTADYDQQPAVKDYKVKRKASFSRTFSYELNHAAVNLTLYTVAAKLSYVSGSQISAVMDFTVTIISAVNGQFSIALTEAQTAQLDPKKVYNYEVRIYLTSGAGTSSRTLLEGKFYVDETVAI